MRNGLLMAEASPQHLMETHNAAMLEDVVLHYCLKTEDTYGETPNAPSIIRRRASKVGIEEINMTSPSNQSQANGGPGKNYPVNKENNSAQFGGNCSKRPPPRAPYMDNYASDGIQTHSVNRIRALAVKNVIVMLRSVGFLLFIFICPAAMVWIYCYAIGSPPTDLGIGIINDEHANCKLGNEIQLTCAPKQLSCAFINGLQATGEFNIVRRAGDKSPCTSATALILLSVFLRE